MIPGGGSPELDGRMPAKHIIHFHELNVFLYGTAGEFFSQFFFQRILKIFHAGIRDASVIQHTVNNQVS
jgi:hypothetical protein